MGRKRDLRGEAHPTAITQLLDAAGRGDERASSDLFEIVYKELRSLARHQLHKLNARGTLPTTSLVHDAYLRLVVGRDSDRSEDPIDPSPRGDPYVSGDGSGSMPADGGPMWSSRAHFFATAGRAMRNIIVDQIRRTHRLKRGGDRQRIDLTDDVVIDVPLSNDIDEDMLLHLDAALDELQREVRSRAVDVVTLRYFAGLTVPEVAAALGVTSRTVDRDWKFARAWLHARLKKATENTGDVE